MATVVKLPQLGESVAEGTIGRWLKQPGDRVEQDEPLVEIQTDKVNAEVPSPVAGFLHEILLPEGTTAAVTADMAIIGDEPPAARSFTYDETGDGGVVGARDAQPAQADRPEGSLTTDASPAAPITDAPAPERSRTTEGAPIVDAATPERARVAEGAPVAAGGDGARRFYTPVVLRMAEEHGLDVSQIQGSGTMGRVTRKDVERAIAAAPARGQAEAAGPAEAEAAAARSTVPSEVENAANAVGPAQASSRTEAASPSEPASVRGPADGSGPAAAEVRALTPMRRAIADHMARARTDIPDAWTMVEIDMTRLVRFRAGVLPDFMAREGYELTFLPFFIKAVLLALHEVPELNATWAGDRLTIHHTYDLGIAVSLDAGLVVPVLRDPDRLSIVGLAGALRALVLKARGGRLALADLQGATFTVNNPGALGSVVTQPIVPLGQAGIVTMEAIIKRPVVIEDDAIAVRSMMNCCLSFDHRVLDGAQALRFLRTIKQHLETTDYSLY